MGENQIQVMKRLLKKLSAMRATLSDEERELLDKLVLFPVDEVKAHRYDPQKQPVAGEVEGHCLTPAAVGRVFPKADPRANPRIIFDEKKQVYRIIPE